MAEAFAGIVCGYALALLYTPIGTLALVRARVNSPAVARLMPQGTSLVALSIILHTFAFFAFTAVGMIFGIILNGLESSSPAGGLGSPNRVFSALVLATVAIAVLPLAIAVARWRVGLTASGLLFAGVFGWAMPYLALLGD